MRTKKQGIDTYRRVSGTVSIDCFDQYRACIEWASGTVTYRYVSGMYRKGQIGCVENGHVFTVFTRVSNGPNPACAESACIVMYRACLERVQIGVQVFACIVMYR